MVDINLNLYRVFYTLAYSKTFSEASMKLCISQPAVSKHIKNLEEILNVKLFDRKRRGLCLTKEGQELLQYVEEAYHYLLAGQKILQEAENFNRGMITVGVPAHIASFYLLPFIEQLRADYPGIFIRIINGSNDFLVRELIDQKLDFVIDSSPINYKPPAIQMKKLTSYDTCFISNDPTVSQTMITDLQQFEYVLPYQWSSSRINLEQALKKFEISLPIVVEVETTDLIINAVKQNIGIGYVVKEAVKSELKQGDLIELKTPYSLPKLEINLLYIDYHLSRLSRYFIEHYLYQEKMLV